MSAVMRLLAGLVVLGLVGFAVRVAGLGTPPLNGDEAFSVLLVEDTWRALLDTMRVTEPNPPLHFVLLKLWMAVASHGEFAARFPSATFGVLLIPLSYVLGARLSGRPAGLVTALLAAVNPYLVWYSHFARAYSLYAALSLVSFVLALSLLNLHRASPPPLVSGTPSMTHHPVSPERSASSYKLDILYIMTTGLALYTHYFAYLSLMAQNLIFLLAADRRQVGPRWFRAQAIVGALVAPWLVMAMPMLVTHHKAWLSYVAPHQALWRALQAYSLGVDATGSWVTAFSAGFGVLFLIGLVAAWHQSWPAAMALAIYLLTPLILVFGVSLARPLFLERYLISIVPAYLLCVALGVVTLSRPPTKARLALAGAALAMILGTAAGARPYGIHIADWRDVARALETRVPPGDVIVQNYPDPAFAYYYSGPAETLVLPETAPLPRSETDARLRELLHRYRRVWLLPQRDPAWDAQGFVETWLERRARRLLDEVIAGHRLLAYEPAIQPIGRIQEPLDWRLGDIARLIGYSLDAHQARAGGFLRLTLFWAALRSSSVSYTVFVHLTDGQHIWGQKDGIPQAGDFPTTDWFAGDLIEDTRVIPIDLATPPGEYALVVGLYRLETGERLLVLDGVGRPHGDFAPIATVQVWP